ncbi:hypothetical protein C1645_833863 [Glomus cerebriforme]|uniref:Uncharacterized protein n=1 Tax=Glomus cerebriforme TaxID=658196 RepID=A0A397SAT8_9GLOM|nr:hypothetical protein C1645_833863 [Glomus cerebriforme]
MIAKDSSSITLDLTHCEEDLFITNTELVTLPEQALASENTKTECQKIPYNQKVEQDLRQKLSSTEVDDDKINKTVAMKLRRKEILCWYCYYKAYEDQVRNVKSKNGVDDKSARTLVYSKIKLLLSDITDINLITNTDDVGYEDSIPNWNGYVTSKTNKTKIQANPLEVSILANVLSASQSKPTYDRTYFLNKILNQYPTLFREFSNENFDYYGITNEKICSLYSLDHDNEESIEGLIYVN